jgi:hypothetical protein
MRRFLAFWWLCVRTAFWGNSASANDWQWIFANPLWQSIGSAVGGAWGAFVSSHWAGAPLMSPETPIGIFLGGLFGFCATWLAFFLIRFLKTPPTLYYEQKDRADALDGTPIARPRSSDKNLAILQERYLSERPLIERELLDYEVDGLRAVNDVTLIFNGLTKSSTKHTTFMNRHNRKIRSIKDSEKKRRAVSKMATDLNSYSDDVDQYAAVFRALTPAMFEYVSQFVERSPQVPNEVYTNFARSIGGNIQSSEGIIQTMGETQQAIAGGLRGVSADLNIAAARLQSVIALLIAEATNYRIACEQLQSIVMGRCVPQ